MIWSAFAERQLDEIFLFYSEKASVKVATKIVRDLLSAPKKLIKTPYIGQVEELLSERSESYRYLVFTNYKIIYSIDEDSGLIKISDVFDTRQSPVKLSRNN